MTSREVFPADDVKLHLGLTGAKLQPMPKSVSWICEIQFMCIISLIIALYILYMLYHLYYTWFVMLTGSLQTSSKYECFCAQHVPNNEKSKNRGKKRNWTLMMPGRVRLASISTALRISFWPICVISTAASRLMRSLALLLVRSLPRGHKSTV